jgi:hypothetical protein
MAKYVGDNEYDYFKRWDTFYYSTDGYCTEEADLESVVEDLRRIAPNIDWRLDCQGSDDLGKRWECIAFPSCDAWEANYILECYREKKIPNFSLKKMFPELYIPENNHEILNPKVQLFYSLVIKLRNMLYDSSEDDKIKLKNIFGLLPHLFLCGCDLPKTSFASSNTFIYMEYARPPVDDVINRENDFDLGEEFTTFCYFDNPFKEDSDSYESLSYFLNFTSMFHLVPAIEDFESGQPLRVARAVAHWRSGATGSSGWGMEILQVLPALHAIIGELFQD